MTDTADVNDELGPELIAWLSDVTGTESLEITRHTGGASRAGYSVDARLADGTTRELWLRTDPGFGPQSGTRYSLRREAAVYRALGPTPMIVAELASSPSRSTDAATTASGSATCCATVSGRTSSTATARSSATPSTARRGSRSRRPTSSGGPCTRRVAR